LKYRNDYSFQIIIERGPSTEHLCVVKDRPRHADSLQLDFVPAACSHEYVWFIATIVIYYECLITTFNRFDFQNLVVLF